MTAIYLAAQPGSGKTVLRNHILKDFDIENCTVVVNTDDLRAFHPEYRSLLSHPTNFSDAAFLVDPDASKWANHLRHEAINGKLNLLNDVTLGGNVENYIKSMNSLKNNGYKIRLDVLAVNPGLSKLGIHLRYETQLANEGAGRFVGMGVHDKNYDILPTNLIEVMSRVELESVCIYRRKVFMESGKLVNNAVERVIKFDKSQGFEPAKIIPLVLKALEQERSREWSEIEKKYLEMRINQVSTLKEERGADLTTFNEDIKPLKLSLDNAS